MTCKTVTCCDLEDFPQTSSQADNCPSGYYWNVQAEACTRIPGDALYGENGQLLFNEDGSLILAECAVGYYWNQNENRCKRIPSNAMIGENGQVLLNEDGEPILEE